MNNYSKNKLLERQINKTFKNDIDFYVGFKLLYSPASLLFKKQFLKYLKQLAKDTGQRFESSLALQKRGRIYIQKRKDPRLTPSETIPKKLEIEGVNINEFIDISLGGIKIKTDTRIKYGDKFFAVIEFDNHILNIQLTAAFIRPVGDNNE